MPHLAKQHPTTELSPQRFQASYCDGQTSKTLLVWLEIMADQISIIDPTSHQTMVNWQKDRLRFDQPAANYLIVHNYDYGDASIEIKGQSYIRKLDSLRHNHWQRWLKPVAIATTVAAIVGIIAILVTEPLVSFIVAKLPRSVEITLAESVSKSYVDKQCSHNPDQSQKLLFQLANRLEPRETKFTPWKFVIVDDQMAANAFAFPGGLIIITAKLLEEAETPEELAGVLAHEMAHIHYRHGTRALVRGIMIQALFQLVIGQVDLSMVSNDLVADLVDLSFSRESEAQADRRAIKMLQRSGISTKGFHDFFVRQQEKGDNIPTLLSSHPSYEGRLNMILEQSKGSDRKSIRAFSPSEWQQLKSSCETDESL